MRTITHDQNGPIRLLLRVPAGMITITAATEFDCAAVALTPLTEGDQAAEQTITDATVTQHAGRLEVRVPAATTTTTTLVTSTPAPGVQITGGTVVAAVIGGTGNVGSVSSLQLGASGITAARHAQVQVEARIPAGSQVVVDTDTAAVLVDGPLSAVEVETLSGDIDVAGAIHTLVHATSGAIRVHVPTSGGANARSTSGDVHVTAAAGVHSSDITARSISGRVRVDIHDNESGTNQ